jgi:serine/threonine protein kinase
MKKRSPTLTNVHLLSSDSRMEEQMARPVFADVCSAIEYMHEKDLVHRDIKTDNVFLTDTGCAKVGRGSIACTWGHLMGIRCS